MPTESVKEGKIGWRPGSDTRWMSLCSTAVQRTVASLSTGTMNQSAALDMSLFVLMKDKESSGWLGLTSSSFDSGMMPHQSGSLDTGLNQIGTGWIQMNTGSVQSDTDSD